MKLTYNLTEEDYINFNMSYAETSDTVKKSMQRARVTGPIMFLLLPFVLRNVTDIPFAYWMVLFGIAAVAWFFLLPVFIKKSTIRQIKKMLKEKGNNFLGPKVLELMPNGIMTKGLDDETMTSYSAVEDITQYKGGVYIYTSSISAIMVSPSAFESGQHREDFIQELRARTQFKPKASKQSIYDKLDNL